MALEERLQYASREELYEHVFLQRALIQRLHARILDLEVALSEAYTEADLSYERRRRGSWGNTSGDDGSTSPVARPPHRNVSDASAVSPLSIAHHPYYGSATPTDLPRGVSEINQVLEAHSKGRPTLPPNIVAQLLLIRQRLLCSKEDVTETNHDNMRGSREYDTDVMTSDDNSHQSDYPSRLHQSVGQETNASCHGNVGNVRPRWVCEDASRIVSSHRCPTPPSQSPLKTALCPVPGGQCSWSTDPSPVRQKENELSPSCRSSQPHPQVTASGAVASPPPLLVQRLVNALNRPTGCPESHSV